MDVIHEVLQVCIDRGLRVNGGLLVGQQVVELHNADGNDFLLLGAADGFLQDGVLKDLVSDHRYEVVLLGYIPPVVTVQTCISVVTQRLHIYSYFEH